LKWNNKINDNNDELEYNEIDTNIEERPNVEKIILPTNLWLKALEIGRKTYKEVGFYMVGLFRGRTCYIYDLVEFDYKEQSGAFIETGIKKIARLRAGLPLGLKIVGNMHKHPGFLNYSSIDKMDYLRYGRNNSQNAFIIYIVEPYDGIIGYTVYNDTIYRIEVEIRELTKDEQLINKTFELNLKFPAVFQNSENIKSIKYRIIEQLSSEILKNFSRPAITINNEIIDDNLRISEIENKLNLNPKFPVFIKNIGLNEDMIIRIFMDPDDDLYDLLEVFKDIIKIKKGDLFNIKFYENGNYLPYETKISNIKSVLTWKMEGRKIKKFNLIFFKELFNLISNLSISRVFGWINNANPD